MTTPATVPTITAAEVAAEPMHTEHWEASSLWLGQLVRTAGLRRQVGVAALPVGTQSLEELMTSQGQYLPDSAFQWLACYDSDETGTTVWSRGRAAITADGRVTICFPEAHDMALLSGLPQRQARTLDELNLALAAVQSGEPWRQARTRLGRRPGVVGSEPLDCLPQPWVSLPRHWKTVDAYAACLNVHPEHWICQPTVRQCAAFVHDYLNGGSVVTPHAGRLTLEQVRTGHFARCRQLLVDNQPVALVSAGAELKFAEGDMVGSGALLAREFPPLDTKQQQRLQRSKTMPAYYEIRRELKKNFRLHTELWFRRHLLADYGQPLRVPLWLADNCLDQAIKLWWDVTECHILDGESLLMPLLLRTRNKHSRWDLGQLVFDVTVAAAS